MNLKSKIIKALKAEKEAVREEDISYEVAIDSYEEFHKFREALKELVDEGKVIKIIKSKEIIGEWGEKIELKTELYKIAPIPKKVKSYNIWQGSYDLKEKKLEVGQELRIDLYNMEISEIKELIPFNWEVVTKGHTEEREEGIYTRMYIKITSKKIKNIKSAKLSYKGHLNDSVKNDVYGLEEHYDNVTYYIEGGDKKDVDTLRDLFIDYVNFNTCIEVQSDLVCVEEIDRNRYAGGILVPYERENMKETNREIKEIWKELKKLLELR